MTIKKPMLNPLRVSIRDAAEMLGISRASIYQRIGSGKLQPHKDGSRTFFTFADLEAYVQRVSSRLA